MPRRPCRPPDSIATMRCEAGLVPASPYSSIPRDNFSCHVVSLEKEVEETTNRHGRRRPEPARR